MNNANEKKMGDLTDKRKVMECQKGTEQYRELYIGRRT